MIENILRKQLVNTGKELLEMKLVARTWGNISARLDEDFFLITPGGLDYMKTTPEDIVKINMKTGKSIGHREPSGEKGIHEAGYAQFADVNFIIHTHQTFATVIGLDDIENLHITHEEEENLGGLGIAGYGLSGTQTLTGEVGKVLTSGNHSVLMVHHGVMICGKNKEEAMTRALLLEDIAKRQVLNVLNLSDLTEQETAAVHDANKKINSIYEFSLAYTNPVIKKIIDRGESVPAQFDDMAQMIGAEVPIFDSFDNAVNHLQENNAILVKEGYLILKADDSDDLEALKLLTEKAFVAHYYMQKRGGLKKLSISDVALMNKIYKTSYSKKKNRV